MAGKIFKRSLALSALMAFVITGSVAAETVVPQDDISGGYNGVIYVKDKDEALTVSHGGTINATLDRQYEAESSNRYAAITADKSTINITAEKIDIDISSADTDARIYGIALVNGGKITLNSNVDVYLNATGTTDARALRAYIGNDGELKISGSLEITAAGKQGMVIGVDSWYGNSIEVGGSTIINLTGDTGRMIGVQNYANNGKTVHFKDSLDLTMTNGEGYNADWFQGLLTCGAITTITKDAKINLTDNSNNNATTSAVHAESASDNTVNKIELKGNTSVTINANNDAYGVYASGIPTEINLTGENVKFDINTDGYGSVAYGVYSQFSADVNTDTKTNLDMEVNSKNGNAYGIYLCPWDVPDDDGGPDRGKKLNGNATLNGNVKITAIASGEAVGIWNNAPAEHDESNNPINENNNGSLSVGGDLVVNATSENGNAYGILAEGVHSKNTFAGNVSVAVRGGSESYAVYGKDSADVSVGSETSTVKINGNVKAESSSGIAIFMTGADSYLNGSVETDDATTMLTLNNGATWNVTGTSKVRELSGDGGKIDVTEIYETDKVTVLKDESTELTVMAAYSKYNENKTEEDNLQTLANKVVNEYAVATGDYAMFYGGPVYEEISAIINEDGKIDSDNIKKFIDSGNLSVNNMNVISLTTWRAETDDMNKRMGELRDANGEHGVWVRVKSGEQEYKNIENEYTQYQIGYDEKLSVDKRWTVGAAVSYTDAESTFARGNGESEHKALSVYGSKLNNDGTYIDLIAKYGRLENDFKIATGMGDAEYDTNAYSLSAEFGKRIQQGKGLWIEPQVELTYGKVSSVDYVSKNGVKVAQDSMESLIGRVGFSLGKDIKDGNVYARASYLYDFEGETSATLDNKATLEQDLGGGWWEVGVGANINLSDATYIYADVEKTFGGEVDTNWQWNLGVRYSF